MVKIVGRNADGYKEAVMPQFVLTRFLTLFAGFIVLLGSASGVPAEDAKPDFRAGSAANNITPPLGELIVGGWKPITATHIHDELYARCLVLVCKPVRDLIEFALVSR